MRNSTVITAVLLCSLSWMSVSGSESPTVEVQPGEEVTLLCSNFSSALTQIMWFRVVSGSQPRCVSYMYCPLKPAVFSDGFQSGKFEMSSNFSTVFLKIKQVNSSDSGLYFCGYLISRSPVIKEATYLQVQEESDGRTKLMFMSLGGLTVLLTVVVICLAVKIKKLQKAHVGEQSPRRTEGSDELNYAAVTFRPKTKRDPTPAAEGEMETVVYAATR